MKKNLIITDLDGTLINTFNTNYLAYKEALNKYNINLTREDYKNNYGLSFHEMLKNLQNKIIPNRSLSNEDIVNTKTLKTTAYKKLINKTILNYHLYKTLSYHKK